MTSNAQTGKRSFGRRGLWILKTVFVSLLLIAILAGLAWAAFWGATEWNRSFDSMTARADANKRRIVLLNEEVTQLKADDPTGEIGQLQAEADNLTAQLAALQEQMTADLAYQSDLLAAMQEEVTVAADASVASVADTATLGDAFLALQNDINESNGRIDTLGGEIDGLSGEFDALRAETTQLETSLGQVAAAALETVEAEPETEGLEQTLALFHVWEQISRARLHLAEDNVGLAADEVEQALRLMDLLVATSAEEDVEALEMVQTRLGLAFNSLPDDAETAVLDLENAWSQLDAILTARLFPEAQLRTEVETETEAEAETEAETEATPTPEVEATPAPTATPSS
ncbi:MAG: hypothetical protein GY803_12075 [Chloroflexi bacterium]|nr:hypothetical protein [Chloroflexota bacterium]